MGITTLNFFVFLAAGLAVYYVIPKRCQWIWLLILSGIFYVKASKALSIFIAVTCISIHLLALLCERSDKRYKAELAKIKAGESTQDKKAIKAQNIRRKRVFIWLSIIINLGMLVVLKFYDLIISEVNLRWFSGEENFFPLLHLAMPLGISFYTFQAVGYLVDVYRGKTKAEHNFFKTTLFITFFPQILQGPISRFDQLAPQLFGGHKFNYPKMVNGFYLMLWGLFKKMVIADRAGILCNQVFNQYQDYHGFQFWVAILAYAAQMYGDFSGGIDIIRGAAQMFGIDMAENFDRPYFSKDIPEFWRRWHVTLGTWFRDYLFYPFSLSSFSQKFSKKLRKKGHSYLAKYLPSYIACMLLWLANGAWHGAGTQFILFGVYHGILTVLSMAFHKRLVETGNKLHINQQCGSWKLFQILRTFFLVEVGRVIFVTPNFHASLVMAKSMFTAHNFWIFFDGSIFELGLARPDFLVLAVACLILLTVEIIQEAAQIRIREWLAGQNLWLRWLLAFGLIFTILIFGIYGKGYDAAGFIYMQY